MARHHAHAESHVFEHRHMPEQRVVLEYEAYAPLADVALAGVGAVEQNLCPRWRIPEPRDDPQQRQVLPEPDGPSSCHFSSPFAEFLQIQAVEAR